MKLVVVESPSKAKTLKGYLSSGYEVVASIGHFRDLPKSGIGIDENNEFKIGDIVSIIESKPISKTKKWKVLPNPEEQT